MKATNKAVIFVRYKTIHNYVVMAMLIVTTCSFFAPRGPVIHYNDFCIYKNPDCKGDLTSSMAENKFQNLDLKSKLFCVDSAAFNNIIDHAHKRKYSPIKLQAANRFLFCFGHYNNEQHQILIANKGLIIDYTARVTFIVDRAEDIVYVKNLINWVNQ